MRNYMKVLLIGLLLALFGKAEGNAQTTVSINPTNDGRVYISTVPGTYASKRDSTSARSSVTDVIQAGQDSTAVYAVYRGFMTFAIPALTTADACTLYIDGDFNGSTTDFEIYLHTASNYGTLDVLDYIKFDGRTVGSAHTGSILNNTWNSSSYSADWNKIIFNAAGLDSLEAHSNGAFYLAMISKEDYINSAPANSEVVAFTAVAGTPDPYLSLTYTLTGWSGTIGNLTNPAALGAYSKTEIKEIR